MPYDEDEARRAARARLEQRMARRAASGGASSASDGDDRSASSRNHTTQTHDQAAQLRDVRKRQGQDARQGSARNGRQSQQTASTRSGERIRRQNAERSSRTSRQTSSPRKARRALQVGFSQLDGRESGISPRIIAIAVAAVILIVLLVIFVPQCSGSNEGEAQNTQASSSASASAQASQASQASQTSQAASQSVAQEGSSESASSSEEGTQEQEQAAVNEKDAMQKALLDLIGEEDTAKLLAAAATSPDALWVAAHPDEYSFDGLEVQVKILRLAANEPQALPFVRSFPKQYPSTEVLADESLGMSSGSPSSSVPDTNIPHLYQWDQRWGNTVYSSTAFGLTGCGPTSFAMVYQGLTGKTDLGPHDFAKMAEERGYMAEYEGTDGSFFTDLAGEFGMTCMELYPTAETLTDALSNGQVVIANMAPGTFTTTGHFFVLSGIAENGEIILNDPYSYERSSRTWPAETIANEAMIFYAYSA